LGIKKMSLFVVIWWVEILRKIILFK